MIRNPPALTIHAVITVHLIFNAHLDPIWLWPWTSGLDAALATCRSACDRLDAHPDLTFNLGDTWVLEQVERCDPPLFERIRAHWRRGAWDLTGGWYIQPDCNLPTRAAFEQQIRIGQAYCRSRFGVAPDIACNVDSFGHAAALPTILRACGQRAYVFHRPQEHELELPARIFRWQAAAGDEVLAFRIAHRYQTSLGITAEHVEAALTELPTGISHTMCFVGVGDHGGGPTERQIAWCRAHRDAFPNCRLEFSTIPRFFDAIAPDIAALPTHTGELQMHAVGCYTVHRPVKVAVRRAEHRLLQAQVARAADPHPAADPGTDARCEAAWRRVCFHQFHDTYGGTCLPSTYEIVHAQLGEALATADETIQYAFRRKLNELPADELQRIVFWNPAEQPYRGYCTFEPWLVGTTFRREWALLDEHGAEVPFQLLDAETPRSVQPTVLTHVTAAAGELRVLRIHERPAAPGQPPAVAAAASAPTDASITNGQASVVLAPTAAGGQLTWAAGLTLPLPALQLIADPSDTWSHSIDRYAGDVVATATWAPPQVVDRGPLLASLIQTGTIGTSRLHREWRVYANEPWVELRLRVHWQEHHRVLKLTLTPPAPIVRRWDGIPGGVLERHLDGVERPLHDAVLLELADGRRLGSACPEIFALDADATQTRLTLLRSALMAHHDPDPPTTPRPQYSDQGEHLFILRLAADPGLTAEALVAHARQMQQPLCAADLTRGMPCLVAY